MNFKINNFFCFIFLFLSCLINQCLSDTVGGNYTLQSHIVFDFGEDNKIHNDAVMENGFTLTNKTNTSVVSTCSYDSYFPVTGFINLNGGSLYLNNNLKFDNTSSLGSAGKIYGNGFSIEFPSSEEIVGVPSSINRGGVLNNLQTILTVTAVYSVDAIYNDKYIVVGLAQNADHEVHIYSLDGNSLTLTASTEIGRDVFTVRWQPNKYYLAVGTSDFANTKLKIYYFDEINHVLLFICETGDLALPAAVRAAGWTSDGKYLALGLWNGQVHVYSFINETLSFIDSEVVIGSGGVQMGALDWNSDENYIVIGTSNAEMDVLVFSFDGSSLNFDVGRYVASEGQNVMDVVWKDNSSLIAVGVYNTDPDAETLLICDHVPSTTISKVTSARIESVSNIIWKDDNYFVLGGYAPSGVTKTKIKSYYFDENITDTFIFITQDATQSLYSAYGLVMLYDGRYVVAGMSQKYIHLYKFNQNYMLFDNTNLVFNSDAEFIVTTTFSGICTINGSGNKVYLKEDGSLRVASGGQLKLQNLELVGLEKTNLQCLADDASIILEDCKLTITSDYTFGAGAILFKGDNIISGTNKFIYSASRSSTIDSDSMLYIDNGITFNYDPSIANRDLLYMQDNTSWLYLDGCTLNSTKTGMRLTRGKLFIENLVIFNAEGSAISEAICFGNANYTTSDLEINILAGADLEVYGRLEYENIN